ncbi:carbonic anhydrase alpha, 11-like [Hyalella azteca]|nr:carbonic anhydrase alpha, 11-like [Hyalella azteca]
MGYLSFDESSSKDSEEFEINDELPLGWNWAMWWTYEGISGPEFWGVINPAWVMCSEGRRQSPINLDPRTLLYDPNLTPLLVDKTMVAGELVNTGHSLEWQMQEVRDDQHRDSSRDNYRDRNRGLDMTGDDGGPPTRDRHLPLPMMGAVNVSGGPLSYQYSLSRARLHYGERDIQGSEHTIDNHAFPAELQLYGHNSQLYPNLTVAASHVYGVLAVSVLIQLGDRTSPALATILEGLHKVTFGGSRVSVKPLRLSDLLPSHSHYLTYEGSLTEPGCHETVTWVLPNKPLYISFSQMRSLRELRQGPSLHHRNAPLGNNFRPLQPSHHRTVRTNIDFTSTSPPETLAGRKCSMAESRFHYRANDLLRS